MTYVIPYRAVDDEDFVKLELNDEHDRHDERLRRLNAEKCTAFHHSWHLEDRADWVKTYERRMGVLDRYRNGTLVIDPDCPDILERAVNGIDLQRADDMIQSALQATALDALDDAHTKLGFAITAYRRTGKHYPTDPQLLNFAHRRFGWRSLGRALNAALNESSQLGVGIFSCPGGDLARDMALPLPSGADPYKERFYVSAEVQLEQRLHEIYDAWAFTPICTEPDR